MNEVPGALRIQDRRVRVGSYRVAYQIDEGELVVLVVKVGDRRDVYRDL